MTRKGEGTVKVINLWATDDDPEDKDPGKWADNIRRKHNI